MTALLKMTSVLLVDEIEPILPFWRPLDVLPVVEVPEVDATDGRLGFVILAAPGIEIMYQTVTNVRADLGQSMNGDNAFKWEPRPSLIYIEVSNLDDIEARLATQKRVIDRRKTFYGATEIGFADPAGNLFVFAKQQDR